MMVESAFPFCPLCSNNTVRLYFHTGLREYYKCSICDLVFVHPRHYLSREAEFRRYELHDNDAENPGYNNFLNKLLIPMTQRISVTANGLDFGSGPVPLLQQKFEDLGHIVAVYDSFYAANSTVFDQVYDFITASEVIEHLHQPLVDLDRLWCCLKPGGHLGIMTGILKPELDFGSWYYNSDTTHVIFFSPASFDWLGRHWNAELEYSGDNVVIFRKSPVKGNNHAE